MNKNAEACKVVICFKHRTKLLKGHTGHLTLYSLSIFKQTRKRFPLITKYVHGVNSVTSLTANGWTTGTSAQIVYRKVQVHALPGTDQILAHLIEAQCKNNKSDVWLTVHRNSLWIRKPNQMSLFVFFITLLIVAQHVSGNHVPIIRS